MEDRLEVVLADEVRAAMGLWSPSWSRPPRTTRSSSIAGQLCSARGMSSFRAHRVRMGRGEPEVDLRHVRYITRAAGGCGRDGLRRGLPPANPSDRQILSQGTEQHAHPGPADPGSPWAIGAAEGGHDAIHPDLGDFDAFDRFVAKAKSLGLEIAMDFALQASPDHPWVTEHPEWFSKRADGFIAYAENRRRSTRTSTPSTSTTTATGSIWSACASSSSG